MSEFEVYETFKAIGPIYKMEAIDEYDYKFDSGLEFLVTFISTEGVVQLKSQKEIELNGTTYTIEWEKDERLDRNTIDVNAALSLPPHRDSPDNIMNALSDDCLRIIFESTQFDDIDLGVLASVCVRFNYIAHKVMAAKIRKEGKFSLEFDKSINLSRVDECLSCIDTSYATIRMDTNCQVINGMLDKYCKIVAEFDLFVDRIPLETLAQLRSFFGGVRKLHLHWKPYDRPFGSCSKDWFDESNEFVDFLAGFLTADCAIEELRLYHPWGNLMMDLPTVRIPQLTSLSLNGIYLITEESTLTFFELNQQIVKLTLKKASANADILNYLPNVQHLKLSRTSDMRFVDINVRFEHLKVLYLNTVGSHSFLEQLADDGVALENLTLYNAFNNHIINSISRMPCLKELCIRAKGINDESISRYTHQLKRLEKIEILPPNNFLYNGI